MGLRKTTPIRDWASEDQPREKLRTKGIESLTDAELLAILLSTGNRNHSAVDLSRALIDSLGGLHRVAYANDQELRRVSGIGDAKASVIRVAFELGKRKENLENQLTIVEGSAQVGRYLQTRLAHYPHEVFYVLCLNHSNEILSEKIVHVGGFSAVTVDIKSVYTEALRNRATGIIVAHNHPAGSVLPSKSDCKLTDRLRQAGEILDVRMLDHIIVSKKGYYSFADHKEI